jgi:uncharacterized cysteine cluster protein YcgN (CxxCxxCC family)
MSGGSYDYVYSKIEDIELRNNHCDHRRAAFQKMLKLVAAAMHDIEWVDSCDYGKGDEHKAIDKVFSFLDASPEIIAKAHAFDTLKDLITNFMGIK